MYCIYTHTIVNGGCAHDKLLTCPSDLDSPLCADELLFLKGTLTFHPFVSGWKHKRRKSARKERKVEDMPFSTQDVRLTMVMAQQSSIKQTYLVFGCHLLPQCLQAIPHLCEIQKYCEILSYIFYDISTCVSFRVYQMRESGKSESEEEFT